MKSGARPEEIHGGKRGNLYKIDPSVPVIVDTVGHRLHDPASPLIAPAHLVDSIDRNGVLQPCRFTSDGPRLLVEDGRTRVLAARAVNARRIAANAPLDKQGAVVLVMVPYVLDDGTDAQQSERMDIANYHRRGHNAVDVARKIAEWEGRGYDHEQIAPILGLTVGQIKGCAAVNKLAPSVVAKIASGELDVRKAPALARLSREEQEKRVSEPRAVKPVTPRALSAGKVAKIREALQKSADSRARPIVQFLEVQSGGTIGECDGWLADLIRGALAAPQKPDRAVSRTDYGTRADGQPKGKPGRKPRAELELL